MFIDRHGTRLMVPPFTRQSARANVKAAAEAWNGPEDGSVAPASMEDSVWRNRAGFFRARVEIKA